MGITSGTIVESGILCLIKAFSSAGAPEGK
jgi:hypothetical protein